MSEKLKPCPHCGGEAKAFFCEESGTYDVQCQQCGALPFLGRRRGYGRFKSMDDVIDAWNRRAERTCRVVAMDAAGSPPYRTGDWIYNELSDGCSECGYPFDTPNRGVPVYCAHCGAKVVE